MTKVHKHQCTILTNKLSILKRKGIYRVEIYLFQPISITSLPLTCCGIPRQCQLPIWLPKRRIFSKQEISSQQQFLQHIPTLMQSVLSTSTTNSAFFGIFCEAGGLNHVTLHEDAVCKKQIPMYRQFYFRRLVRWFASDRLKYLQHVSARNTKKWQLLIAILRKGRQHKKSLS